MEDDEETMVINDLLSFLSCKSKVWPIVKLLEDVKNFYPEEEIIQAYRTLSESIKDSYVFNEIVTTGQDALKTIHSCFLSVNKDDLPVFVCRNIENIPELPSDEASSLSIPESSQKILEQALYKNHSKLKIDIAEVVSNVNKLSDNLRIFATKVTALSRQNTGTKKRSSLPLKAGQKSKTKAKSGLAHLQKLIDEERPNKRLIETGASEDRSSTDEELTGAIIDTQKLRAKGGIMPGVSTQQKRPSIVLQPETTPDYKSRIMAIRSPKKRGRHEVVADQKVLHIKSENDGIEVTLIKSEDDTSASMNELSESSLWSEDSCGQANDLMIEEESLLKKGLVQLKTTDSYSSLLNAEEAVQNNSTLFACSICCFSCTDDIAMDIHVLLHPGERAQIFRKENYNPAADEKLQCKLCLKEFRSRPLMNNHTKWCPAIITKKQIHKSIGKYSCSFCGVCFGTSSSLVSHRSYHDDMKTFECSICGYRYYSQSNLNQHYQVHLRPRFQCPHCLHGCTSQFKLNKHVHIHTGYRPFECHLCCYQAKDSYALNDHLTGHTEAHSYACDICGKFSESRKLLTQHKQIHSSDNPMLCSTCGKIFRYASRLQKHLDKCSMSMYAKNY